MQLYFDSNVYGFIDERNERSAVRGWQKKNKHRLVVSDEANLGELVRTPDLATRARLVDLATHLGDLSQPPTDMIASRELLGEIGRLHPEWISTYPSLRSASEYVARRRREMWEPLKADPSLALSGTAVSQVETIARVLGENRDAMRKRRDARAQGDPAYTDLKLVTREQMRMDWQLFLTGPTTPSAEIDWLRPALNLNEVFARNGSTWRDFWDNQIDVQRIRMNYLSAVVVFCQKDANIGNSIDRIHAVHLLTSDRVVTADENFYKVMQCARAIVSTPGLPVLVDRSAASAVAELQKQIP